MSIINELREQLRKTGYEKAMQFTNENLKGKDVVTVQMPN